MAAEVNLEEVEQEILILKAVGDEQLSYLQKFPAASLEDSFSLKLHRKPLGGSAAVMTSGTHYLFDHEKGLINYLVEFVEDEQVYVTAYEYETIYYKYLSSLRASIGDDNFDSLRYNTRSLITYFHKAIFEKVNPESNWNLILDTNVNRVETAISDTQLGFINDYAALYIQRAELKQALRKAIIISDRSSKLDTTKHLKVMQDQVATDEKELNKLFQQYLMTSQLADGSLRLAIKDSIKARTKYIYDSSYVLSL